MIRTEDIEENQFEAEVKGIASHLWPDSNGGSVIVEGRERDGIYVTDEVIHIIECTVSRRKDKAEKDVDKLSALVSTLKRQHREKVVKPWFITRDEPTADQRTVAQTKNVVAFSFEKFQAKLIAFAEYKNCRANYPFGSVRNPETGSTDSREEYIDIDLLDFRDGTTNWGLNDIIIKILSGTHVIIQGHYGVGKSMSLKETYKRLVRKYDSKEIVNFPIYLNLRDHHGQRSPVEALERHARNIGFSHPEHLVRAWRAGYAILLLDGFDEIAAFGWAGKTSTLKEVRYKSMELVREFLRQSPRSTGILLCGRINYFDSIQECERAFVISPSIPVLKIGDFTPEQVSEYLAKRNINITLPDWLPTRPLLVGYLVSKGILEDLLQQSIVDAPAEGWDYLLGEICKRESAIEAGLAADTIRELIEAIACYCRQFQNGLGPIYKKDLESIFYEKCGYQPDDRALVLLQRLPGLAPHAEQDGSRYFIDHLFASAAKAGEIVRYIMNPFDARLTSDPRKWQDSLDYLAIQLISSKLEEVDQGLIEEAVMQAKKQDRDILAIDVLLCLNYLGKAWKREAVTFENVLITFFEIQKDADWSRVIFREVIFREILVEELPTAGISPWFEKCIIGKIEGCSEGSNVVESLFLDSVIESFEEQNTTTSALLRLDLPTGVTVGLTILKKLYLQSGNGRQEHAFYRGLSTNEQPYVVPILALFSAKKIAMPSRRSSANRVWQPMKNQATRVRRILLDRAFNDPLIEDLKFVSP
jgi:hypothetical protein